MSCTNCMWILYELFYGGDKFDVVYGCLLILKVVIFLVQLQALAVIFLM